MVSTHSTIQRRKSERARRTGVIRIETKDPLGHSKVITADLLDISRGGMSVAIRSQLQPGSQVLLRGNLGSGHPTPAQAEVRWCQDAVDGFRAGLMFTGAETHKTEGGARSKNDVDYYELLQLSPNADFETIARVYRLLAQRYHPDNSASGNSELFVQLGEAYRVLGDPEARARYDAVHEVTRRLRWRIFDSSKITAGKDQEHRKRRGVLALLYAKMVHDPEQADMTIFEFEDLLGCPREHLHAALWYLRGKGYMQRTDNGRYTITIQGFDEVERNNWICNNNSTTLRLGAAVRER